MNKITLFKKNINYKKSDFNEINLLSEIICNSINNEILKTQKNIVTIYGPGYIDDLNNMDKRWKKKERERKRKYKKKNKIYKPNKIPKRNKDIPIYNTENKKIPKISFVEKGSILHIYPKKKYSLLIYGLNKTYITFHNKFNHIIISKCNNIRIYLLKETISGIDLLNCKNIYLYSLDFNYINLEYSSDIDIYGNISKNSKFIINRCINVFINNKNTNASPFLKIIK